MHAVRTPLAGIAFAFAVLLVETFAGGALVTPQTHEERWIDPDVRASHCERPTWRSVFVIIPQRCLDNPLAKDCS